jgi:Ferritin-like
MIQLQPQCLEGVDTLDGLQQALQNAIELEHATLPTYLYAMYSLDQTKNSEIYGLIHSIVMEEMSHFGLACNILNAIGGSPAIDTPGFVPTYPGPLPCGVEDQLTVPLAPFSIGLVQDVFMVIEEPEFPTAVAEAGGVTIGQLYAVISAAIVSQGSSIFTGAPGRQVSNSFPVVTPVTDVDTATAAIDLIVEQGEGTLQSPDDAQDELAHYYKFAEIAAGKELVANPNPPPDWYYEGAPIPFDPTGVLPVVTNPKASQYSGAAKTANDQFNKDYSTLLADLHTTFNGNPGNLGAAIGDMDTLAGDATTVMNTALGDGTNAGPSFEYVASSS